MPPTPSPFPGWKVLPLFCRGRPEWLPLPVASNRFFSCRKSVVSRWPNLGQSFHCKRPRFAAFLSIGEAFGERRTTNDQRLTTFIQTHFLDVVRHGRFNKTAQRFARSRGLANRGGRDRLVDLVEQMNGHALQHQIPRGSLLMKRTCHLHPRTQAHRQRVGNIGERKPWPAGYHKLTFAK